MKIISLETFAVPRKSVFLKIMTDEGIVGWGEPTLEGWPITMQAAVQELSPYLIGKNPLLIEEHWQTIYRHGCYRGGPILMSLIAGIDQALWDIKGKYYQAPVYELIGGKVRDRVKVYTWIGNNAQYTIAQEARRVLELGYTAVKMCPTREMNYIDSYKKIEAAVAHVAEIRAEVGYDLEIGLDFHGRVHKAMAKILAKELEPFKPMFLEDPILSEHAEALRDIARSANTPIAIGERLYSRWDFKNILANGYADILNPDPSHAGGISECKRIFAMAEAYDVAVAPHCPLGPIALAACLQLDASTSNAIMQEQSLNVHKLKDNPLLAYLKNPEVLGMNNGFLTIPEGPGLGIEIDEDYVREQTQKGNTVKAPYAKNEDGSVAEW